MNLRNLLGVAALAALTALPTLGLAQRTTVVRHYPHKTVVVRHYGHRTVTTVRHHPAYRRHGRVIVVHPRHHR